MSRKVKVSIILPSLNVAMYIKECMESVMNQSLSEIEIICVDAGSTDGTFELLKDYEKRDERIKVLKTDRKSYGYQMNLGISTAIGEYIGIVETDDYVPREMYEELYEIAKKNDVDIIKADFYRFTGKGDKTNKSLCCLAENHSFYNRVINIEEEQQCFLFPVNTWCGIYRRRFLCENNIFHNETLGASFQDTGFWFQTFACAKKAYFVNKPYYMNRRDNPGSSVFSKRKMFCLCDEYDFIESNLKNNGLFEKFKHTFAYVCYQAYWGNLIRVTKEFRKEYLERFQKKFSFLYEQRALDIKKFSETEWHMISLLLEDIEDFNTQYVYTKMKIFDECCKYEKIIIYGAGIVGKYALDMILYHVDLKKVYCFAVTKKEREWVTYQGIPVYDIHDLLENRKNSLIIVAVSKLYQLEVCETLSKLGFMHVEKIQ